MQEFLKFFDEKRRSYPMHLEIYICRSLCSWSNFLDNLCDSKNYLVVIV